MPYFLHQSIICFKCTSPKDKLPLQNNRTVRYGRCFPFGQARTGAGIISGDIIPYRSDMVLSEGCARFADVFVLPLVGRKSARYNIWRYYTMFFKMLKAKPQNLAALWCLITKFCNKPLGFLSRGTFLGMGKIRWKSPCGRLKSVFGSG